MFHFPWKIHGVSKGPPHNHLVSVEHKHLLELYDRALRTVELWIALTAKPAFSDAPGYLEYQSMEHDRDHYKEVIAWLENMSA